MLPPRIIAAPISATTCPKAAVMTAASAKRASRATVHAVRHGPAPSGEQHVARDDRLPRVQPAKATERAAARQDPVQQQSDHDGREGERGIDHRECGAPAPEAARGEEVSERQSGSAGDRRRDDGYFESYSRDSEDFGITRDQ